jgi:Flp pilus assembly protein TadD
MSINDLLQTAAEHFRAGRLPDLQRTCEKLLQLEPENPEALSLMSIAARELGHIDDAVRWASLAVSVYPHHAPLHANLGEFLRLSGDLNRAQAEFQQAIQLNPNEPTFHNSLGVVYGELRQHEKAASEYHRAIELLPTYPDALNNLGGALRDLDKPEEAAQWIMQALQLQPHLSNAYYNFALVLADQGRFDEAIETWSRAIAMKPYDPHPHWNLGMLQLLKGDFDNGWREYRWRHPLLKFDQPQWTGEDPAGKTILLHAEQGIGDAIQFVRYAPLVAAKASGVKLMAHPELVQLLSNMPRVKEVIPLGSTATGFDVHCPLLSLPGIFETTPTTIPAQVPYLNPSDDLTEKARNRLGPSDAKLRVGLVWAGRPENRNDSRRSLHLDQLAPILATPGVQFFSLQKGPAALDKNQANMIDLAPVLHDFAHTAAYVKNLDLVIAVDTAVAHLAGALGKAVWVLIPAVPDWRWMLERTDSPWYPTMRLFRQKRRSEWSSPINEVCSELTRLTQQL